MPTYEYRCSHCTHELEAFQPITAKPLKQCPSCGKNTLERLISGGGAIIFKGGGFYQTDYRSEAYKKAAESESKAASPDTAAPAAAPADKQTPAKPGESKPAEPASPTAGSSKAARTTPASRVAPKPAPAKATKAAKPAAQPPAKSSTSKKSKRSA